MTVSSAALLGDRQEIIRDVHPDDLSSVLSQPDGLGPWTATDIQDLFKAAVCKDTVQQLFVESIAIDEKGLLRNDLIVVGLQAFVGGYHILTGWVRDRHRRILYVTCCEAKELLYRPAEQKRILLLLLTKG